MKTTLLISLLLALPAAAATLDIDPAHSNAQFSVRHMMVSTVHGEFGKVSGTVEYDAKDPSHSAIEAKIDAASVNTHTPDRDGHLKSPDFFDVAKCPSIDFKSTKVEKAGEGHLKVTGDLTMHCVTRPITLDVEGPSPAVKDGHGNNHYGASGTGKVSRKDYGLLWNKAVEGGGVLVGDEVTITLDVELIEKGPAKADKK